jgi:hypothetical protein
MPLFDDLLQYKSIIWNNICRKPEPHKNFTHLNFPTKFSTIIVEKIVETGFRQKLITLLVCIIFVGNWFLRFFLRLNTSQKNFGVRSRSISALALSLRHGFRRCHCSDRDNYLLFVMTVLVIKSNSTYD